MTTLSSLFQSLEQKKERFGIGLISGTSVDGVDAALVRISGCDDETELELIGFETFPYPPDIRTKIMESFDGSTELICQLNFQVGRIFAECAKGIIFCNAMSMEEIDFIASHGQTIYHVPPGTPKVASTFQIGDGDVIAERTGRLTISDFRTRDMAAGGDGAPLVPLLDQILLTKKGDRRGIINLGGISNITVVDGSDACNNFAFDIGPGNMLMDAVAQRIDPKLKYDPNGELAKKGTVDRELLGELIQHDYFKRQPPKSTGRELFGEQFAETLIKARPDLDLHDLLATVTALTAKAISNAIADHVVPRGGNVQEILLCGGGVHNDFLVQKIADAFPDIPLKKTDDYGIPADAKEAMAFALMGNQTIMAKPGNVPRATGAGRSMILGKISLPSIQFGDYDQQKKYD